MRRACVMVVVFSLAALLLDGGVAAAQGQGDLLWAKRLGAAQFDFGYGIAAFPDGGWAVTGGFTGALTLG